MSFLYMCVKVLYGICLMLWYVVLCSVMFCLDARWACASVVMEFYVISSMRLYLWLRVLGLV